MSSALPVDLEALRRIFADRRYWLGVGIITAQEYGSDGSSHRVKVKLFPDNHEVVADVAAASVGPSAGIFGPISVGDMAVVGMPEGTEEHAIIIGRLASSEDPIPQQARDGHTILKSLVGKNAYLWGQAKAQVISATRINLALSDHDAMEPLILGLVMQQAYEKHILRLTTLIEKMIAGPMTISSAPSQASPTHPNFAADILQIKTDLAADKQMYSTDDSTNFLSKLVFTERGGS